MSRTPDHWQGAPQEFATENDNASREATITKIMVSNSSHDKLQVAQQTIHDDDDDDELVLVESKVRSRHKLVLQYSTYYVYVPSVILYKCYGLIQVQILIGTYA